MKFNRKNKILLLSFCVALYLSYLLAITNTITYYKIFKSQLALIENSVQLPTLIPQLKYKEKQLDKYLKSHELKTKASFQTELLKKLTIYTKNTNVKITDFKEPHYSQIDSKTNLNSFVFSLEGSFNNCLKTINYIENDLSLGTVKHIHFVKVKNFEIKSDILYVEIILQNNLSINM